MVGDSHINNIDYNILNKLPNFMENTFKNNLNYNFVYVVDIFQLWGSLDVNNILKSLQNIIKNYKPKKIICIGISAGGYMSILFGNLLAVDKIISFAPQINILDDLMNPFRHHIVNEFKMFDFKYKNLNILQPFISKTIIYLNLDHVDMHHINKLDAKDNNLAVNYISKENTHDVISTLTKNKFIELVYKEIENKDFNHGFTLLQKPLINLIIYGDFEYPNYPNNNYNYICEKILFKNIFFNKNELVCELIDFDNSINIKKFHSLGINFRLYYYIDEEEYKFQFKMKANNNITNGKHPKVYTGINWIELENKLTMEYQSFEVISRFKFSTNSKFRLGLANATFKDYFSIKDIHLSKL